MLLDLNPREMNDLREALRTYNNGLYAELAHADQREYREMLRAKVKRYEALAMLLDHQPREAQPPSW